MKSKKYHKSLPIVEISLDVDYANSTREKGQHEVLQSVRRDRKRKARVEKPAGFTTLGPCVARHIFRSRGKLMVTGVPLL